jgi:hypothetical protein
MSAIVKLLGQGFADRVAAGYICFNSKMERIGEEINV